MLPRALLALFSLLLSSSVLAQLSVPRSHLATVTVFDLAIFAGGENQVIVQIVYYDTVDIWNATARTWTASGPLSVARTTLAAGVADGVVLFAGGFNGTKLDVVDMYDTASNTWSVVDPLSEPRSNIAGASAGSLIVFAGGLNSTGLPTSAVDIYNSSGIRIVGQPLKEVRESMQAAFIGSYIIFAGGRNTSVLYSDVNTVDKYDAGNALDLTYANGLSSDSVDGIGFAVLINGTTYAAFIGGVNSESPSDQAGRNWTDICNSSSCTRYVDLPVGISEGPGAALADVMLVLDGDNSSNVFAMNTTANPTWQTITAPTRAFQFSAAVAMPAFNYIMVAGGRTVNSVPTSGTTQVLFFDTTLLVFFPQPTTPPPTTTAPPTTTPQPTTPSPPPTTASPCPGTQPAENATCDPSTGQWVLPPGSTPGSINLTNGQVLVINGSLNLPGGSQVVVTVGGNTGPVIFVEGDAGLDGTLVIVLSSVPADGSVLPIFQADNFTGNFTDVQVVQPDRCSDVGATTVRSGSVLSVLFTVADKCGKKGFPPAAIAGIVLGALIALAAAVFGGLMLLRRRDPTQRLFAFHTEADSGIR